MAKHGTPMSEGEVVSVNVKAVRDWLKHNRSKIKLASKKTLFYSGRQWDLEELLDKDGRVIPPADRKTWMGTPVWKRLEKIRGQRVPDRVPVGFQSIDDVLARLPSPPIVDRDGIDKEFVNARECFRGLKALPALFPRVELNKCWSAMSEALAANAAGDIKILDGAADDYAQLNEDKDFISRELPALLRNPNLSEDAKELVRSNIEKYRKLFDRRYTASIDALNHARKTLRGR